MLDAAKIAVSSAASPINVNRRSDAPIDRASVSSSQKSDSSALLQHHSNLGGKFGLRTSPTDSPVIGRDRRRRIDQLLRDTNGRAAGWKRLDEIQGTQRKLLGASLQCCSLLIHTATGSAWFRPSRVTEVRQDALDTSGGQSSSSKRRRAASAWNACRILKRSVILTICNQSEICNLKSAIS